MSRDRDGDDRALHDVEQRQRRLALHRGLLPALHALVVAARLPFLVAEVLDGLVVEQAVDRARVGLRVELVHLPAEPGAPVGDEDRRGDVERERGQRDRDEGPVIARDQDRRHEPDLDQRRQDGEEREADQRRDPALAALDVPGEAAGLAREVEAQRQRVQVAEGLQRDRAHRALRHLGEQVFAQLGERGRRQPEEAVRDQQHERHHQHRGALVEPVDDRLHQHRHADVGDLGERPARSSPPARVPCRSTGTAAACGSCASRRLARGPEGSEVKVRRMVKF